MQNNTEHQKSANLLNRLVAFVIDKCIVGAILLTIETPLDFVELLFPKNFITRDFFFQYSLLDIGLYILGVLYFVLCTYLWGATLGKQIFRIKVVSVEDRKPTFFEVLYRETVGRFLSGLLFNVGYLIVFFQKDHQGLHDLLSDTKVVVCSKETEIQREPVTEVVEETKEEVQEELQQELQVEESTEEIVEEFIGESIEESAVEAREEIMEEIVEE